MNRKAALLLVAAAVAAGAWTAWRPRAQAPQAERAPQAEQSAGSCTNDTGASCTSGAEDARPPADVRQRSRRPTEEGAATGAADAPATPADSAAEGDRLRDQADRLLAEGRVHDAVDAMRKAAEIEPNARNHGDLGALLERLTAFRDAARHLTLAAELDPSNADRWLAAANAWYRAVEPGEAWKAERRAKQAEPGIELRRDAGGRLVRADQADDTGTQKP